LEAGEGRGVHGGTKYREKWGIFGENWVLFGFEGQGNEFKCLL